MSEVSDDLNENPYLCWLNKGEPLPRAPLAYAWKPTGNVRNHKNRVQYEYKLVRTGEVSVHIGQSTTWRDLDPDCVLEDPYGANLTENDAEQMETDAFGIWVADLASSDSDKEEEIYEDSYTVSETLLRNRKNVLRVEGGQPGDERRQPPQATEPSGSEGPPQAPAGRRPGPDRLGAKFVPTKDRIPNQEKPGYAGVFRESSKWNPTGEWADRVSRQSHKPDEHKGWKPAPAPRAWRHPAKSMRHEEEEDWDAAWENPDFNESPSPERQPGKFSKVPLEKKAPQKKVPPWRSPTVEGLKVEAKKAPKKKEEPKKEAPKEDPPAQEATEPGESQPSVEVEATVAADLPQNPQEEPAAPAGPEPAAEPEPAQPPEAARANLSFG